MKLVDHYCIERKHKHVLTFIRRLGSKIASKYSFSHAKESKFNVANLKECDSFGIVEGIFVHERFYPSSK